MNKIITVIWFFLVLLLVMIAEGSPLWVIIPLLVIIFGYAVFRDFHPKSGYDEMQIQLNRYSSHIALYVFTGLVIFVMLFKYKAQGLPLDTDTEFYMLLLVPLIVKMVINVFRKYETYKAAAVVCYVFGSGALLFVVLSHGFSLTSVIEASPFLPLILAGYFAKKYPIASGIVLLILGMMALFLFLSAKDFDIYIGILMCSIFPFPMMLSGSALLIQKFSKPE